LPDVERSRQLLPGWVMVSAESGRLLENPDQLAVDLAGVLALWVLHDQRFSIPMDGGAGSVFAALCELAMTGTAVLEGLHGVAPYLSQLGDLGIDPIDDCLQAPPFGRAGCSA